MSESNSEDETWSRDKSVSAGAQATGSNRIFLNFSRDVTYPERDCVRIDKVKKLFRLLSEREDLQEIKVLGWFADQEEDASGEEEEESLTSEEESEDECEDGGRTHGGQRFAMSRDFWYRKLNILKAQKLDEVALEAKDIPERPGPKEYSVSIPDRKDIQVFADEIPEKQEEVMMEIDEFERKIAEIQLKSRFVNIYDNKIHFCQKDNPEE